VGRLRKTAKGRVIVKEGRKDFGSGVSLEFDKTLTLTASARDCVDFAAGALRDWFAEAHRTGQRFDAGLLPRDRHYWVAYETGLASTTWKVVVRGDDHNAGAWISINPPDKGRSVRIATLAAQGIPLSGLSGKAQDVYTKAVATYMADALVVE
jgi:hypothetical protein